MKLATVKTREGERVGIVEDKNLRLLREPSLLSLIRRFEGDFSKFNKEVESLKDSIVFPFDEQDLLSPIPNPTSMRDGYAFRQHVLTARRNRGLEMIPEFDLFPVFYFTNHQSVSGPGNLHVQKLHLERLDYELE